VNKLVDTIRKLAILAGGLTGGLIGSLAGPWGIFVGGVTGGVIGALFCTAD